MSFKENSKSVLLMILLKVVGLYTVPLVIYILKELLKHSLVIILQKLIVVLYIVHFTCYLMEILIQCSTIILLIRMVEQYTYFKISFQGFNRGIISFKENSSMVFSNNNADKNGGAIFTADKSSISLIQYILSTYPAVIVFV